MSLLDTASLIVTPNAYKEGKLYSVIPSDGSGDLSVTRATTATRVNSSGLVELVPYNLVQYSEQFDNAAYIKQFTIVTANTTTAPNGTLTADTIVGTTNSSSPSVSDGSKIFYNSGSNLTVIASNNTVTGSVYIYSATAITVQLFIYEWGGSETGQSFTLTPNTWQRIEFTKTFVGGGSGDVGMAIQVNANTAYIWGAQLVEGSVAKDYQKTETRLNIPRLDYSNGTCPSILVEPQRTNLVTYSSSFDNAAWGKYGLPTLTGGVLSPDGTNNAFELTMNVSEGIYQNATNNAGTYACSIWIKGDTNGVIGLVDGNSPTITQTINVSAEWKQVSVNLTKTAAPLQYAIYRLNSSYLSKIYIYGAQCELGSYPTSYIPTTSASVTRNADVISKTGISSLIGQTEGVIFIDAYRTQKSVNYQALIGLGNGTSSTQMMEFFYRSSNELTIGVYNSGQQFVNNTLIANGRHKIALAYKANDFALYIDGVLIATDNSGTVPTMNQLNIGGFNYTSGDEYADGINAVALWQTRLTNTQLASLTTL